VEVLQLDQAIHKQLARSGGFCGDGEIPLLVARSGFCHSNAAEAHDKQSDPEEISRHGSSPHPKNEHLPGQLGRWRENNPNLKSYKVTEVIQDTAKAKTNWVKQLRATQGLQAENVKILKNQITAGMLSNSGRFCVWKRPSASKSFS
jgi:hypothetical protein